MEGNIFDYLEWRGDISFEQSGLNAIDGLIFCCLAYVNYARAKGKKQSLKEAYEITKTLPKEDQFCGLEIMREDALKLAEIISNYDRFKKIQVINYVELHSEETEKQFSAMTFLLPKNSVFIAFRGTDNTLVGWKENLNMSFTHGTPAQLEATEYVENIAAKYPKKQIYLGGHSKGGNLAVWAAIHCPERIQERIQYVFNHDGPGFIDDMSESAEYKNIEQKLLAFVPESSIIGMLMGSFPYLTIESSSVSLMQHQPFSWKVLGKHFIYKEEKTFSSKVISGYLNNIIETMSPEELEEFVDKLYENLKENDVKTISDLKKNLWKNSRDIISQFREFKGKSAENVKRKNKIMKTLDSLGNLIKKK
ncbi:MAG: DUF2974 domain-containing protein [Lachnospiraceae bacterium]|nr:DUF2974 domain-containing protein [Lachnospiraceae bacterium]